MLLSNNNQYFDEQFDALQYAEQLTENSEFEECIFIDCDFSDGQFKNCRFIECSFKNCNLSSLKWNYSSLENVSFSHCKLNSLQWADVDWPALSINAPVSFNYCELSNSSFFELTLKALKLTHCFAKNVDFRHADLSGSIFTGTDFRDSEFFQTNVTKCDFVGATAFNIDLNNNMLANAKFDRFEALNLLTSLNIELCD
ncbi:pentapeptide repeat-containing protein [Pseudoalteromonas sp. NZS11_1]|uniref:pentapeptide repeat-containing protein n=1 Tax=Pseudoalteromonas sp. NZS11_1 TaxID=2792070 RepID=UPI0018CE72B8|nr:pentapeptide repeat-containing protein [Pseudoalteromonas sp. NZS11_1]